MKKRALVAIVATGSLPAAIPATSHADTVDPTCRNGSNPVVFSKVDARPVALVTVRALCVQEG